MSAPSARRLTAALAAAAVLAVTVPVGAQEAEPQPPEPPRLATPILSARRVPDLLVSQAAADDVAIVADELMADAPASSCLVVHDDRTTVFSANASLPLAPASTLKLLTATAALDRLGADHVATTEALASEAPTGDGVLDGDLFLVGGGDALLLTEGYRPTLTLAEERLTSDFDQLADAIVDAGVREIDGDVVGDDGRYDDERYIPTWPDRYKRQDTIGPLSALSVNDGVTGLSLDPDQTASQRVAGDPPLLAAETLVSLLEDRGVEVSGGPRTGAAPAGATRVASLDSPPLAAVLDELLGWSDNSAAELLTRELDVAAGGAGTTPGGLAQVRTVLEGRGLPLDGVELVDGSGLDLGNRLTCDLLVAVLDDEAAAPSSEVLDSLAVAGETGTLWERMEDPAIAGRVRAKTGTLNSVLALAGVVDTAPGDQLTFAFVMNIPPEGDAEATTALQDALVEELVTYPQAPGPDEVGPAPVTAGS